MVKLVEGVARCLAKFYADGVELMEIHTSKSEAQGLPFVNEQRVPVKLHIGGLSFAAGLRATDANPYVWISPNLKDDEGRKVRLADVLINARIGRNQKVRLLVDNFEITLDAVRDAAPLQIFPEEVDPHRTYVEGATMLVQVTKYERDASARSACIAHYGTACSVCLADFSCIYGEIGVGFIHVHHLIPLTLISAEYVVDPIKDMIPVCPNCHAMLHRRSPPYAIGELKLLMEASGQRAPAPSLS